MKFSLFLIVLTFVVFIFSCGKNTSNRCVSCTYINYNSVTNKNDTNIFKTCKIDDLNYSSYRNGISQVNSRIITVEFKSVDEMLDAKLKSNYCKQE